MRGLQNRAEGYRCNENMDGFVTGLPHEGCDVIRNSWLVRLVKLWLCLEWCRSEVALGVLFRYIEADETRMNR